VHNDAWRWWSRGVGWLPGVWCCARWALVLHG
jgi:hypothetical protein